MDIFDVSIYFFTASIFLNLLMKDDEIKNISLTDTYNYNFTNTGASYPISMSFTSNMLLNLINDNSFNPSGNTILMLDRDLKNKQKIATGTGH